MGNIRSLASEIEELMALTRLQGEYPECSLMLHGLSPDSLVTLEGFQSILTKGAVFVNERWCNPGHTSVREQCCTRDIEQLDLCI